MAFAGRTCINTKCIKMEFIRHLTFGRVHCTALIPALQVPFMVQFPVVAWGLHRVGIIMVSCSAYPFLYQSISDPHFIPREGAIWTPTISSTICFTKRQILQGNRDALRGLRKYKVYKKIFCMVTMATV